MGQRATPRRRRYPWSRASARRDYMINRAPDADEPDDGGHVRGLEAAGARRLPRRGPDRRPGARGGPHDGVTHELGAANIVLAVGSTSKIPPIEGIETIRTWTNSDATLARELPASLLVLGGGPTGFELAQVYARFGVPVTIVQSGARLAPDRPSPQLGGGPLGARARRRDVRLGVRALRARGGGRRRRTRDRPRRRHHGAGHAMLLAVGRRSRSTIWVSSTTASTRPVGAVPHDGRLRIADGLWVIGDPAGSELHTHQAHYQGEMAVRMALGDAVTPDYRALPRATYTDPEAAFVGLTLDQARRPGSTRSSSWPTSRRPPRATRSRRRFGHVTIVVDRASRQLVGAAMACPDASAAIHECVLAIKARVTVDVLADTIHAFPSTSRILNGLFADARRELDRPGSVVRARPRNDLAVEEDQRRRAVARAPPGSTGSSRAAAGTTTMSARWPGTSRPRSASPA